MISDTVCVVGLGYIGLPTAAMFAQHGKRVTGVDVSERVVSVLRSGSIHIEEPGLEEVVRAVVEQGSLIPQSMPSAADAFIIAVPTPTLPDHSADLSYVHAAATAIVPHLRPGNLVILESTSPPGTTLGLIPILEQSGLIVGRDILLAHSPERVLPGRILVELVENDRVIGGQTAEAATAGRDLYQTFVTGHIHLIDATTAEMAKLMENTSRDVNIALANEFAKVAEVVGIDVFEAIELANCHPRVNILKPGPGVGGHCIAVDPWFIVHAAPEQSEIIRTARQINDRQPEFVARLIEEELGGIEHPSIAVLGLAYKADVDDVRESPSIEVVLRLRRRGFDLRLHDAHATRLPHDLELALSLEQALADTDLAVILTDHAEYRALQPTSRAVEGVRRKTIFDTRNCIDPRGWEDAGWRIRRLGASTREQASIASTKWGQA